MSLQADVEVRARGVDLQLEVAGGTTTAVIGPNGSGKSTLLEAIAGVVRPDSGRVVLDGRVLFGPGRDVPAHRRGIALLSQDARLFPRMDVLTNVAFPARARGEPGRTARAQARDLLERVRAADLAGRRPRALSGGQAQRVALARALAARPRVLLLDEPLAALDVPVASEIRLVLQTVTADQTCVLVTHAVLDAALLADRLVVVDAGRVVEAGPTTEVMTRPRSVFAAQLCGLNVLSGRAMTADTVTTPLGEVVGRGDIAVGASAVAAFTPASVAVYRTAPGGSPRNAFRTQVVSLQPIAGLIRVHTPGLMADLTPAAVAALALRPGDDVVLTVKAAEVRLY